MGDGLFNQAHGLGQGLVRVIRIAARVRVRVKVKVGDWSYGTVSVPGYKFGLGSCDLGLRM